MTFVNVRKYRTIFAYDDFVVVTQMRNMLPSFFSIIIFCFILFSIYLFIKVVDRSYRRQRICRHYHSLASYTTLVMKSLWIRQDACNDLNFNYSGIISGTKTVCFYVLFVSIACITPQVFATVTV